MANLDKLKDVYGASPPYTPSTFTNFVSCLSGRKRNNKVRLKKAKQAEILFNRYRRRFSDDGAVLMGIALIELINGHLPDIGPILKELETDMSSGCWFDHTRISQLRKECERARLLKKSQDRH